MKKYRFMYGSILMLLIFVINPLVATNKLFGDTLKLTLNEAIALGLKNSSTIEAKTYKLKSAIAQLKMAESAYYPQVSSTISWQHLFDQPKMSDMTVDMGMGEVTIPGSYTAPKDPVSASLNVSQIVYGFGKTKLSVEIARKQVKMAEMELKEEKRKLIVEIKKAFYGYILAKELYRVMEETLNNKKESYRVTKERYESGLIPDYEVLSAETDVAGFIPQVISAENRVKYSLIAVKNLLGIKDEGDFDVELIGELKPEIKEFDEEKLIDTAIKNKFSIEQFKTNLDIIRINKRLSKSSRLPTVSAFLTYSVKSGYDTETGENKYWGKDSWDDNLVCGINISVPISSFFPWSREKSNIEKVEYDLQAAMKEYDSIKSGIELQIKNLLLKLNEEKAKIESGVKSVELAQKFYNSSKERYEKGLISRLEFDNAEVRLNNAKISYLQAIYNYKLAVFDLMDAVGVTNF